MPNKNKTSKSINLNLGTFSLSKLLNTEVDVIRLYVKDLNQLKENIDKIHILKELRDLKEIEVISDDYNIALVFSQFLKDMKTINKKFSLLDDYQNIDRSYVDFEKLNFDYVTIPYAYLPWNVNFNHLTKASIANSNEENDFVEPIIVGDGNIPNQELVTLCKNISTDLLNNNNFNSIDKIILITNYLQKNTQYISLNFNGFATEQAFYTYDKFHSLESYKEENIIKNNFGNYEAMAKAMILLLNNPILNINIRAMNDKREDYIYNYVQIDDTVYYIDNSWNIVKSEEVFDEVLKTTNFNSKYLLYGKKTQELKSDQNSGFLPKKESYQDLNTCLIDNSINKLKSYGITFEYKNDIPYIEPKMFIKK